MRLTTPAVPTTLKTQLLALCAVLIVPHSLQAQQVGSEGDDGIYLEEVIVTSRKRFEMISDTPISLQVVTGDLLDEQNILNLQEMAQGMPNVYIRETILGDVVFIRGVGSGVNAGFEQTVGTYVDGIYYGRSHLTRAPFFDIERVEILRGPQGILFGKNTIAGAVSISTVDPQEDFGADISAYWGPESDDATLGATLNVPLTDQLFSRLSLKQTRNNGFAENEFKNRDEPERDIDSARLGLRWDINDSVGIVLKVGRDEIDMAGYYNEVIRCTDSFSANVSPTDDCKGNWRGNSGGAVVFASDGSTSTDFGAEGIDSTVDTRTATLTWETDAYIFTAVSGYAAYEINEFFDGDFTPRSQFLMNRIEDFTQISQEFRLVSAVEGDLEWLLGAYWQSADLESGGAVHSNPLPGLLAPSSRNTRFEQDADSAAVFGQLTYHFSDKLQGVLGLRYAKETKDALQGTIIAELAQSDVTSDPGINGFWSGLVGSISYDPIVDSRDEKHFTPSLNLQFDFNEDTMFYGSISKGFKGGGYDFLLGDGDPEAFEYDEEKVISYELGSKLKLADGQGELNLAVFYSDFDDIQVSIFNGVLDLTVDNAASTVSKGIEFDGRWRFTQAWLLGFAGSWLVAEYREFDYAQCYAGQSVAQGCVPNPNTENGTGQNFRGQPTMFAPEFMLTADVNYESQLTETLRFAARLDVQYIDDYAIVDDDDPFLKIDAYTNVNLRLSLFHMQQRWGIALIGKNLSDEYVFSGSDIPGEVGSYFGSPERRRNVGVQFDWHF